MFANIKFIFVNTIINIKQKRSGKMVSNIPWMKKEEQPEYSNDILPSCFFKLQTIDDDNETNTNNNNVKPYKMCIVPNNKDQHYE